MIEVEKVQRRASRFIARNMNYLTKTDLLLALTYYLLIIGLNI